MSTFGVTYTGVNNSDFCALFSRHAIWITHLRIAQNLVSDFKIQQFLTSEAHVLYFNLLLLFLDIFLESMEEFWRFEIKLTILKFWTKIFNYLLCKQTRNEARFVVWPQERMFFQSAKVEFFSSGILTVSPELWN